ncbi:hypothetical protein BJY17_002792 [Agromyces hippuratus]|uniref:Uncharacterized protein n=1 Tax=Agromyces hippuratus TaxID=286438 RepID=A0A852X803_9MICO|nr:hypothetical protein [Agromyces hippuratus]NYG22045.1 hypothetical protein [Agromyces hippuratus]
MANESQGDPEHWWPKLSIGAKHRLLADLDALIDAETAAEIEGLCGVPPGDRLDAAARAFIITQIEAVD